MLEIGGTGQAICVLKRRLGLFVFYVRFFGVNNKCCGYDLTSGILLLFIQNLSSCHIT